MEAHERAVAAIAQRVKTLYEQRTLMRIRSSTAAASARPVSVPDAGIVDTSALNRILHIDRGRQTALVEPHVTMAQLVEATLAHDLIPAVVPSFPSITVGDSFSATAAESSSFRHGFFASTVTRCDLILGNGSIARASPSSLADLLRAAAGALGTLGIPTLLEVRLVPAARNVELTCLPTTNATETTDLLATCCAEPFDYVDGIQLAATRGVVLLGRITHQRNHALRRFARARDPWLFEHAGKVAAAAAATRDGNGGGGGGTTETVPLRDFLFRYERGAFWVGAHLLTPLLGRATRFLLDPRTQARRLHAALRRGGPAERFVVQDVTVPAEAAAKFVEFVNRGVGVYPLWLCPVRADAHLFLHDWPTKPKLLMNLGIWGPGRRPYGASDAEHARFVTDNRALEQRAKEIGGRKWLYGETFLDASEFGDLYDLEEYNSLRKTYLAELWPSVYDAMQDRQDDEPSQPFRGVVKAVNLLVKK